MSCSEMDDISDNIENNEFLEEEGFSPEEITDLRDRVNVAQEAAELESWKNNDDAATRQDRLNDAKASAIEEWHKDIHAKLNLAMEAIKNIRVRVGQEAY